MPPVASRFGKYELIAILGHGGMAHVYLALARGLGQFHKLVVIKRLRDELAGNDAYRALLLEEARLAARLSHPNVVMTLEVGEEAGQVFLAMEYLDGQSLHRFSREAARAGQPLDLAASLRIVADVLAGLRHAHTLADYDGAPLGIVHRDVSPQNVFVTYAGEVKLVDFGIAKAASAAQSDEQTEIGVLKGKLAYMAPEQTCGPEVDARADLYCAGIILFELVTQKRLFAGEAAEKLRRVSQGIVPRLSEVVPGIDPELDALVARALARAKEERFQSAEEMRAAIEGYMDRRGLRARSEDVGQRLVALFAEERREMRRRIKERVLAAEANAGALPLAPLVTSSDASVSVRTGPPPSSSVPPPGEQGGRRSRVPAFLAGVAALGLAGGALAAWTVWSASSRSLAAPRSDEVPPGSAAAAPQAAHLEETVLRLRGSNTVGAELAPALVMAFFRQKGAGEVRHAPGKVSATMPGKDATQIVVIEAEGTATAFKGLAAGECDVGMASRAIHDDEAKAGEVAGLGDLRSAASEHVLGLDGIAVVVHRNNPLKVLDTDTLGALFSGETRDWSKVVPEKAGSVTLYARDDKSGTFDTFKSLALGSRKLAQGARRFAESDRLSDEVASDLSGIGFIGLAYVRSAKAVAISDHAAPPMLPSPFTVTTEGYPLSRRLYLYTPGSKTTRAALDFVTFALSAEGQKVVREAGFVDLNVGLSDVEDCDARCPPAYAELAKRGRRLSLDFRFRYGTGDLDSRGTRDVDRLVLFLRDHPGARLMLLGFSDATGDAMGNVRLSRERARKIAAELEPRGVHPAVIEGFGAAMPVASNTDEHGRARNRRVEAWIEGVR